MPYNPSGIVEELSSVERAAYDALDKTPAPAELAHQWREHATVGWTKRYIDTHSRWCPALRVMRRLGVLTVFLMGAILTLNILGAVAGKAMVREAVHEALVKEGVLHSGSGALVPLASEATP
jgi:hypothetical protein